MTDQNYPGRPSAAPFLLFIVLYACSFFPAGAQAYDIQLREAPYNYTYSLKPDSLYLVLKDRYSAAVQAKDNTTQHPARRKNSTALPAPLKPLVILEPVQYDTDDPAIWINPADPAKSLVVGTDKDSDGGLYVFNLEGKIVNKVSGLKRPNNVDIAYGLKLNGRSTDIAVLTERESGRIRIYSMPDLKALDKGGIEVFFRRTGTFAHGHSPIYKPCRLHPVCHCWPQVRSIGKLPLAIPLVGQWRWQHCGHNSAEIRPIQWQKRDRIHSGGQ